MTEQQLPLPTSLAVIRPKPHPACAETIAALQRLLTEAQQGRVTGLAMVILHDNGAFKLELRGEAIWECNQMGVTGMLAALQKMVLELY